MSKEKIINNLIVKEKVDKNLISDGYHTFGELYDHRISLFIVLCKAMQRYAPKIVWKCQTDKEWFLLGINYLPGDQITYHLPMSRWEEVSFAVELSQEDKPKFDGHTSKDVLNRLKQL